MLLIQYRRYDTRASHRPPYCAYKDLHEQADGRRTDGQADVSTAYSNDPAVRHIVLVRLTNSHRTDSVRHTLGAQPRSACGRSTRLSKQDTHFLVHKDAQGVSGAL